MEIVQNIVFGNAGTVRREEMSLVSKLLHNFLYQFQWMLV